MNTQTETTPRQGSSFRGYWAIDEFKRSIDDLVTSLDLMNKRDAQIKLRPVEYDLIVRWPAAAAIHGFSIQGGVVTYRNHVIARHVGRGRYDK